MCCRLAGASAVEFADADRANEAYPVNREVLECSPGCITARDSLTFSQRIGRGGNRLEELVLIEGRTVGLQRRVTIAKQVITDNREFLFVHLDSFDLSESFHCFVIVDVTANSVNRI